MSSHIQKVQIDSRYRKSGTINNFQVELPYRGLCGHYELKAFNIYNSYTNINSINNKFLYTINDNIALSGTMIIPSGSYTIVQLATTLKDQLSTATGLVWSVVFSSVTFKMTFSTSLPFFFAFDVPDSIAFEVGMEQSIYFSTATSLTSVNQVGLSTQPMSYFVSLKEANNEMTLLNSSSTTFVVPILTSLNELNYYEPSQNSRQFCSFTNETKYLNVAIYNHQNQLIDFQNDFYFILEKVC